MGDLGFAVDNSEATGETMKPFIPNRHFRRKYDRMFRTDPLAANVMLLLAELADDGGQIIFDGIDPAVEIQNLMLARFDDPRAYQLGGGPER